MDYSPVISYSLLFLSFLSFPQSIALIFWLHCSVLIHIASVLFCYFSGLGCNSSRRILTVFPIFLIEHRTSSFPLTPFSQGPRIYLLLKGNFMDAFVLTLVMLMNYAHNTGYRGTCSSTFQVVNIVIHFPSQHSNLFAI